MKSIIALVLISIVSCQVIELSRKGHRASIANLNNFRQANSAGNFTMSNVKDMQYFTAMTMGTPAQNVNIVFDTGSPELWISTIDGAYKPKTSTTANVSTTAGNITYGKGFVAGYRGTDVVGLPQVSLSNIKMKVLFVDQTKEMEGFQANGLMGLSIDPNWTNCFQIAQAMGQLQDSVFAFDLRNADVATYFYIGTSSFPAPDLPLYWMNSVQTPSLMQNYFVISIVNTTVGNVTTPQAQNMTNAVVDSGTSVLMIDFNAISSLHQQGWVKDLCKNIANDEYICTCIGEFPDVYFNTPDGHQFHVVPDDYMVPLVGEAFCLLGIMQMEIDIPVMIFGDAFMRNYFVAYDKINKKVGFSGAEQ